jgi:hypothetical protein
MSAPLDYRPIPYAIPTPEKPGVVTWFKVYAVAMAVLYLGLAAASVLLLIFAERMADSSTSATEWRVHGAVMLGMGIPLAGAFVVPLVVRKRPWVWIYDLVLICLGLTSCATWPATIPLLIFWIKPEVKAWFGREP